RPAYRFTVEDSVYVHADHQRQGLGRALLTDLLQRSDALGYRNVIALISADQTGSVALHRALGFVDAGLLKRVGFKFDRWLAVLHRQRDRQERGRLACFGTWIVRPTTALRRSVRSRILRRSAGWLFV